MKKLYMTPETTEVMVETRGMLATSITLNDTQIGAGESLAPGMTTPEDLLDLPPVVFQ